MKNLKKILALLLALSMLLCLSACGSFEKKMAKSAAKMGQLKSMHMDADFTLDTDIGIMGQSVNMDTTLKAGIDLNTEPFAMKMDLTVAAMGTEENAQVYVVDEGGQRIAYTSDDGGKTWERGEVDDFELGARDININGTLALISEWAESFEAAGEEKIGGSTATKYSGNIDSASLVKLMISSGANEMLESSLGVDLDDDAAAALSDVPVSIWIDNKSGMIVRIDMELTELMQSMVSSIIAEVLEDTLEDSGLGDLPLEIKVNSAIESIKFSQFDAVGTIELPAGVK